MRISKTFRLYALSTALLCALFLSISADARKGKPPGNHSIGKTHTQPYGTPGSVTSIEFKRLFRNYSELKRTLPPGIEIPTTLLNFERPRLVYKSRSFETLIGNFANIEKLQFEPRPVRGNFERSQPLSSKRLFRFLRANTVFSSREKISDYIFGYVTIKLLHSLNLFANVASSELNKIPSEGTAPFGTSEIALKDFDLEFQSQFDFRKSGFVEIKNYLHSELQDLEKSYLGSESDQLYTFSPALLIPIFEYRFPEFFYSLPDNQLKKIVEHALGYEIESNAFAKAISRQKRIALGTENFYVFDEVRSIVNYSPRTELEFRRIYGRKPSIGQNSTISRLNFMLRNSVSTLQASLESDSPILFIIGHNKGEYLSLPNGTNIALRSIKEKCQHYLKLCVLLICNSDSFTSSGVVGNTSKITGRNVISFMQNVFDLARTNNSHIDDFSAALYELMLIDGNWLNASFDPSAKNRAQRDDLYLAGETGFIVKSILFDCASESDSECKQD